MECPELYDPDNGEVNITGTRIGSEATYSCDPGYQLSSGQANLTCQQVDDDTADWNGVLPTCEGKSIRENSADEMGGDGFLGSQWPPTNSNSL